jgi:hydroxyacylglutathione hydrolase
MLYESISKIKKMDKTLRLYPGHGSGSACGKSIGAGNFCTLGAQHEVNYGFLIQNKK